MACIFGMFPSHENLKYFEEDYRKTFDPEITELNMETYMLFPFNGFKSYCHFAKALS